MRAFYKDISMGCVLNKYVNKILKRKIKHIIIDGLTINGIIYIKTSFISFKLRIKLIT